jgi:hypothetical protein
MVTSKGISDLAGEVAVVTAGAAGMGRAVRGQTIVVDGGWTLN